MNVLLLLLMILFVLAWMVAFWVQTGTIRDARESGHPYWMVNPRAIIAGYRAMNFWLYGAALLVGGVSALLIFVILIFTGRI
jgi:hypothetical protein